jgi:hypothetical protein
MDEQIVISLEKYNELLVAKATCRMLRNMIDSRKEAFDGLSYNEMNMLAAMLSGLEDTQ